MHKIKIYEFSISESELFALEKLRYWLAGYKESAQLSQKRMHCFDNEFHILNEIIKNIRAKDLPSDFYE